MPETVTDRRRVPPHIAWRRVEDQVVALDLNTSIYWSLDGVGAWIWERLAEGRTAESILEALGDEYDVQPETAREDLQRFLGELEQEGLVARL